MSGRAGSQLFGTGEWCAIGGVTLVITLIMLVGYHFALGAADDVPHARTMAIVTLVSASATVTAGLLGLGSRVSWFGLFATISSAAVLVQTPSLSELLHLSPLHFADWAIAATGGLGSGLGAAVLPKLQRRAAPCSGLAGRDALRQGKPASGRAAARDCA
jgi:Ca2+-transporting ATPase